MLLESSLTGTTFEQSFSGRKNNPYLLQESEEQASKEVNSNAYINVESNIVDKDNNAMIISCLTFSRNVIDSRHRSST